jgi:hypothetical protein
MTVEAPSDQNMTIKSLRKIETVSLFLDFPISSAHMPSQIKNKTCVTLIQFAVAKVVSSSPTRAGCVKPKTSKAVVIAPSPRALH